MMTKTAALLSCFSLLAVLPATAAWQDDVNSGPPGPHLKIRPINLSYAVSWDGKIQSGRINFLFGRPDKRYPKYFIAQSWGGSRGIAKGLFPYEFQFTSFLHKHNYRPVSFTSNEQKKREVVKTDNIYGRSVKTTETTTPQGGASSTVHKTFSYSGNTIYDLFSAILYIRSLPLKTGTEKVLVVQAFDSPYLARIKVEGREPHNGRNCVRVGLKLQKIDPATMKLKSYKKLKSLTLWISDDAERLPIEIRSKVFIGDVRLVLDGRKYL